MANAEEKFMSDIKAKLNKDEMEKLVQCKSADEAMGMLGEAGIELPDEMLEGVAGGRWIWELPLWEKIAEQLKQIVG